MKLLFTLGATTLMSRSKALMASTSSCVLMPSRIWSRSRSQGAEWLWLEVRISNVRAQQIYERHGYRRVGERKAYYPDDHGKREDAVVMSLKL